MRVRSADVGHEKVASDWIEFSDRHYLTMLLPVISIRIDDLVLVDPVLLMR